MYYFGYSYFNNSYYYFIIYPEERYYVSMRFNTVKYRSVFI